MMNVDLGIWDKLSRAVVVMIFVAALVGIGLWYLPTIQDNERMRKTRLELEKKIEAENQKSRQIEAATRAMQTPRAVEKQARELHGLARTNEMVFQFVDPATNHPPARTDMVRP